MTVSSFPFLRPFATALALLSVCTLFHGCLPVMTATNTGSGSGSSGNNGYVLNQSDAASGLKEALLKGINQGVALVSRTDGYFGNTRIRIPFPEEARPVEQAIRGIGLNKLADDVVLSINRAAEDAAQEAKPIFMNAIQSLTFSDAISLVSGADNAATEFLRRTTSEQLKEKFKPVIGRSLTKVNATRLWSDAMNAYNRIPLVQRMNPDLEDYVAQKAIDGLFVMVAEEEKKIRENPLERTSDLLRKVFGNR